MFSARAAITAARSRAFMPGSGNPSLAATVISRASLPNSLDLAASCRPLRCMMFLNCECPAMVVSNGVRPARRQGAARANPVKRDAGVIFRRAPEWKPSPERRPRLFESTAETYRSDTARETGRIVGFDRDRAQRCRPQRRFEATRRDSAHETVERLVLAHPDHGIVVAGHADIGDERGAARQDWWSAVGAWVWVPTTRLARPSQKCPMACFSLVASQWISTMTASASRPSAQAVT